jgi:hypothetical protein
MSSPIGLICGGAAGLAGLVVATAEILGGAMRIPVYAGGIAGLVAGAVGLVFAIKLARLDLKEESNAFWKWWGGGMLVRLVLIGTLGIALSAEFKEQPAAALLTMMGVYLLSMFAESAWLAQIFFNADKKKQ